MCHHVAVPVFVEPKHGRGLIVLEERCLVCAQLVPCPLSDTELDPYSGTMPVSGWAELDSHDAHLGRVPHTLEASNH